jgi:hypothetical protein
MKQSSIVDLVSEGRRVLNTVDAGGPGSGRHAGGGSVNGPQLDKEDNAAKLTSKAYQQTAVAQHLGQVANGTGDRADNQKAARAHDKAEGMHDKAAAAHSEIGNSGMASQHRAAAEQHSGEAAGHRNYIKDSRGTAKGWN